MYMKISLLFATALVALASCTNEEFIGDEEIQIANESSAISFSSGTKVVTRATANTGTAAEMLDKQFKVYGVKTLTDGNQKVFANYGVWWADGTAGTTTSNSKNWEYVEVATSSTAHGSTDNPMGVSNQTIKYWDHAATDYRFVAGSPFKAFTFTVSDANVITGATVTGMSGHINANPSGTALSAQPVYIADPLIVPEASYAVSYKTNPVTFHFTRQQARVRVGIYETIPGYVIKEIHFYTNGTTTAAEGTNVILTSGTSNYFTGGTGSVTLNYNWTTSPASYSFAYSGDGLTQAQNWYGGAYTTSTNPNSPAIPAFTSNAGTGLWGTDKDMDATTGYFTVIPTTSTLTAAPLLIKCDYVLLSEKDGSGETIKVTGATAAIPAAFSKWKPNTSYTYLFKISDNTNGYTGSTSSKTGLYPITFDAVVTAEASGTEQGTVTSVSTPSITTYQAGSVTTNGIKYVKNTPIYLTVADQTSGALNTLTDGGTAVGAVQVYSLGTTAKTEADMQITAPTGGTDIFTLGGTNATVNTVTFTANKYGSFTPTAAGYYAIQYLTTAAVTDPATPAAYTYKIVHVEE